MEEEIEKQIGESLEIFQKLIDSEDIISGIKDAARLVITAFRNNRKLLLAGNGGSAAEAQHIAAEFVNRFGFDRPALPAIALSTDTSILTSIGNDLGFEKIFSRQVMALGEEGDVFIGISTSGTSENIIRALHTCREKSIVTVGLTGIFGGPMKDLCDICIKIPSEKTPRIQEAHNLTGHIICSLVENELFNPKKEI